DDELELEGIYLSTEEGVLSLAVHGRGLVKVSVPDGFDLPALKPGHEVSLHAAVESDGTFTLVSLDNEDAGDGSTGGDGGVDMGDQPRLHRQRRAQRAFFHVGRRGGRRASRTGALRGPGLGETLRLRGRSGRRDELQV